MPSEHRFDNDSIVTAVTIIVRHLPPIFEIFGWYVNIILFDTDYIHASSCSKFEPSNRNGSKNCVFFPRLRTPAMYQNACVSVIREKWSQNTNLSLVENSNPSIDRNYPLKINVEKSVCVYNTVFSRHYSSETETLVVSIEVQGHASFIRFFFVV